MNKMFAFGLCVQLLSASTIYACPEGSVAQQYLSAIETMNWSKMESMLADDAVYTDPTMIYFDSDPIHRVGPPSIAGFWRSGSEESGTSKISYTTTQCFETAGYFVVNLDINVRVAGAYWNVDKDWISLPGKVLSIIRVTDGKVKEHHDYVEYSAAETTVSELQRKYGVLETK
ncbi:nuclear transport factor 2 family protein [Congregibacter brevis]|uniref:Nuclear transport factor 2 family protein n=1 Tax=Congregibacter brevis TaxID=3081201 RepID=A0ABZ0IHI9_9GAMM|nr:nuclear transport factor 2 family protein [Congregibacter sp. IMCC45268]